MKKAELNCTADPSSEQTCLAEARRPGLSIHWSSPLFEAWVYTA